MVKKFEVLHDHTAHNKGPHRGSRTSLMSWILGIAGLNFVVLVHEMGHFVACKLFGVATPVFSVGFGPVLLSQLVGSTTFQLAVLPLGGFVSIDQPSFNAQAYWVKLCIMLAGILTNILFAGIVFFFLSTRAKKKAVPTIAAISSDSPAEHAGLHVGDTVRACNEEPVGNDPHGLIQKVLKSPGTTIMLVVERAGAQLTIPVAVADAHPLLGAGIGWVGIEFQTRTEATKRSLAQKVHDGIFTMGATIRGLAGSLGFILRTEGYTGLVGPFGIIAITGKSVQYGMEFFFLILALLSINIALFNLLPIPLFDGGKAFIHTVEAITGPAPEEVMHAIYTIFFVLLILFFIFISVKDMWRSVKKG